MILKNSILSLKLFNNIIEELQNTSYEGLGFLMVPHGWLCSFHDAKW